MTQQHAFFPAGPVEVDLVPVLTEGPESADPPLTVALRLAVLRAEAEVAAASARCVGIGRLLQVVREMLETIGAELAASGEALTTYFLPSISDPFLDDQAAPEREHQNDSALPGSLPRQERVRGLHLPWLASPYWAGVTGVAALTLLAVDLVAAARLRLDFDWLAHPYWSGISGLATLIGIVLTAVTVWIARRR